MLHKQLLWILLTTVAVTSQKCPGFEGGDVTYIEANNTVSEDYIMDEPGVYSNNSWIVEDSSMMDFNQTRKSFIKKALDSELLHWPIKKEAVMEGHVILGGLMMVHEREDNMTCGPIMPQGGIQALEAMMYTLDRINEQKLLPDITIGAHILDDCDKDTYGLEMAVDFIRGEFNS